jgi:hypothetical protein
MGRGCNYKEGLGHGLYESVYAADVVTIRIFIHHCSGWSHGVLYISPEGMVGR